jgi:hypothetical protein
MTLAPTVAAVSKRTKRQRPSEDSEDDEDDKTTEPVSKRPKKVAAVTQTVSEPSPETSTRVWEVEDSELSDLN